ncbi:MAG: PqqD family protein [bacterium]
MMDPEENSRDRRRISIAVDVVFEILDREAVLLNLNTGVYFTLNEVGTRIWQLIEQRRNPSQIRQTLLEEYNVQREVIDADLNELLSELASRGLVFVDDTTSQD